MLIFTAHTSLTLTSCAECSFTQQQQKSRVKRIHYVHMSIKITRQTWRSQSKSKKKEKQHIRQRKQKNDRI